MPRRRSSLDPVANSPARGRKARLPRPRGPAPPVTRRSALQGLGGALGAAALGCASDESNPFQQGAGSVGTGGGGTTGSTASASSSSSSSAVTGGGGAGGQGGSTPASCTDTAGLTPEELLANIDTWVILCMENRSFDHY